MGYVIGVVLLSIVVVVGIALTDDLKKYREKRRIDTKQA